MPASFLFYDLETFGADPRMSRIAQFAAIRTDANLNEVARFETRSRLQPHVLPHPSALRTNGLPIEWLTDANLPSPTSVQAITEQVAAADRFGAFLESYRTKLLKTAEAAQSANEPEAKPRTSAAADVVPASAIN